MSFPPCVICKTTFNPRMKQLKDIEQHLMKILLELMTYNPKYKTSKSKYVAMCLHCHREVISLYEYQQIVEKKHNVLRNKIECDAPTNPRRPMVLTQTLVPRQQPDSQKQIPSRSIICTDAEITITEEEIDQEIVKGISDLQRGNGLFGCRFCKSLFTTPNFTIKHMQEMHSQLLHKCEVCNKEFCQKDECDTHRATHLHEIQLPYPCGNSSQSFKTFDAIQEHSRTHQQTKKFGCSQAGFSKDLPRPEPDSQKQIPSRSIIGMDAEITITEEENGTTAIDLEIVEGISDLIKPSGFFGCRFCKRQFTSPNFAIKHMQHMHGKLLHKCEVCSKEFRQKDEFDTHRATHLEETQLPYPCGNCVRSFKTFEEFQEHSRTHQQIKKFGCAQCGRRFKDETKLHKHMINHNLNPYSCQRCKKTFRSKVTWLKHRKLHGDNQKFSCDLCSKHFLSADALHLHLKNHSKQLRCLVCDKVFDSADLLNQHSKTHSGDKRFSCSYCGKLFISMVQLECHIRVHTGERPFQCDVCGARFAQRSNLDSHHRSVHLQAKPFKCSECDKSYKRRRLLEVHIRSVHTGERPYKCKICHAAFAYPEHCKKHMRTHSGIKPHACEICSRTFASKDNRDVHRYIHGKRKPYECQVCGFSCMRKQKLVQHIKDEGHGDPEEAGVKVAIEVKYDEIDPSVYQSELNTLQQQENITQQFQTIMVHDETGKSIEYQIQLNEMLIQAFQLQEGNVDETLAALLN